MTDRRQEDGERWTRVRELFEACLELSPAERSSFLDDATGDDARLRQEVEQYLAADAAEGGALDQPAEALFVEEPKPVADPGRAGEAGQPSMIGPYRIHEVLGEGGMGTVYRAVQTRPVQREVALKVIKPGMDTREVVARFESERQALAVMDHPHIAKVLEGGATDSGRPYFAMELVRGVPIHDYCDTHKLGTAARLDLFVQVCDAVQHAHQKGVIHRDLKPTNVLVAVQEAAPVPKVIDFGVAKAVGSALTDRTLMTSIGQIIGTPEYMSPEQAERTSLDVDTRTDVYSLGVMLYELLSGALPFDREMFRRPEFMIQWLLREKEAPTPSARLHSLADTQETVARNRRTDVRTLRRELSGDLDWIVMKAMEKDRTRRYGTVAELGADLRRYLASEPVSARPPSTTYRFRKFARRHRGPLAAGIALALSLVGGATVSTMGFVQADQNAALARAAAERAEAVTSFLDQMLRTGDPVRGGSIATTVEDVLDAASDSLDAGVLSEDPLVEIAVRRSIGGTYMNLGMLERASEQFEAAWALQEATPSVAPLERVTLLDERGQLLRRQGDAAEAERLYRRALTLADSAGLTTDGGDGEGMVNGVRNDLALALRAMDRIDEAAPLLETLYESERELLSEDDPNLATTLNNLALIKRAQGDFGGALEMFEEALRVLTRAYGDSHIYIAAVLESIGSLHQRSGRYEEAKDLMTRSLAMRREILPRGPAIANSLNGLGLLHVEMEEFDDAAAYLNEALQMSTEVEGENHPRSASILNNLGLLHLRRAEAEEAERAFRRSVSIREEVLGPTHRNTLNARANLAAALVLGDQPAEAQTVAREVVEAEREIELTDPTLLGSAIRTWGLALVALRRFEEAEPLLFEAYEMQRDGLGSQHQQTRRTVVALVELYEAWDQPDDARAWADRIEGGG